MPRIKSAKKRLRKSKKRALRNKQVKDNIDYLERKARRAIKDKEKEKALGWLNKFIKAVDKAIQKGILKKNTGARKKSRLMKKFNVLK